MANSPHLPEMPLEAPAYLEFPVIGIKEVGRVGPAYAVEAAPTAARSSFFRHS